MSEKTFLLLFAIAWVAAAAYALSAWRLLVRVRKLKATGEAADAPDPFTNPLEVFGYLGWRLSGRYADLNDAAARRWARIARPLFIAAAPLILAMFAVALTQLARWTQPT
ncbi:MAG TPA: hypothetical protein VFF48_00330 [Brevundimonas sp.]|nr:hypothetical protein [Brevundimonas sp.]